MNTTSTPTMERSKSDAVGQADGGAETKEKPIVHALYDITPRGFDELVKTEFWQHSILPTDNEWVAGFTGPRGGGKSLEMAYLACRDYLIRGRPVWSNIPIAIELHLPKSNEVVSASSLPLDTKSLFSLSGELQDGLVCIDELELYAEARRSGSNKNLLLSYVIMQVRKRSMSFFYTIQQPQWTDNRLQFMSDIMIRSRDIAHTVWGKEKKVGKGQYFSMVVEDWSGMLTGYRYQETGMSQTFCLWGVPVWGMYNSYDVVDVFDALTPVDLNLSRMRISTGETQEKDETLDKLNERLAALSMAGFKEIKDADLWQMLQVDGKEHRMYGQMLKHLGVGKKQRSSGYVYLLPEYEAAKASGDED